ncbi:MAG: sulfur carrier protein ThiS [Sedimentisphaerales bacterium]|nr:sulfur carrier protein ThiS [Sedimentisphaerales bacterium]
MRTNEVVRFDMLLKVNGEEVSLAEGLTVTELLKDRRVKMPEMVSVELNGRILRRSEFDTTSIAEGDKVEFLYFMGGGRATD